jgi:hypothetical protein
LDKATEASLTWWIRFWDDLTPKSHSEWDEREELFVESIAEDFVKKCSQLYFHQHGTLEKESLKTFLESDDIHATVKQWIIKAFVEGGESSDIDKDTLNRDWAELVRHQNVEKLRQKILILKQKIKNNMENPEESAQVLQEMTQLGQKLNNYLEK